MKTLIRKHRAGGRAVGSRTGERGRSRFRRQHHRRRQRDSDSREQLYGDAVRHEQLQRHAAAWCCTTHGTFDEAPILANICGQWSKPRTEINDQQQERRHHSRHGRLFGELRHPHPRLVQQHHHPQHEDGPGAGRRRQRRHRRHRGRVAPCLVRPQRAVQPQREAAPARPATTRRSTACSTSRPRPRYITVSYNYFHDHAKVGLDGSGDSDDSERRITYAHNRYENVGSRLPLQRFGYVHSTTTTTTASPRAASTCA